MYLKILRNDLRKNLWKNLTLFLFICLSAAIAVTVTLTLSRLFSSISSMYETAAPPHFLQMHKGEFLQEDIDIFNEDYEGITHWQTVQMVNLYGEELIVSKEDGRQFTLSECRLDISFVRQNKGYDVLLDEYRNPLEMAEGEIGVPVILLDEFDISPGDRITVESGDISKTFTVSAYVYDGQMNSTLCSSTRFLISDKDFDALSEKADEKEYLIEAWFEDTAQATDYQTAYEQSSLNLPKNGQAITYTMIFLLSALTDLLMAVVFLLAGALLIVVALVCLRYAVLAELEEDMREIGTMKGMGIPRKGIRDLYLGKIRLLTIAGCVLGVVLAFFLTSALSGHISRTFGSQPFRAADFCLAALSSAAVYGVILLFSKSVLRRLEKATVTDLLVTEKGFGRETKVRDGLRRRRKLPTSLLIGAYEVRRGYGIVFGLLFIVSFLIMIPIRTVQTMKDGEFVTYMGSPVCDLLLEVEQGEDLEARRGQAEKLLAAEMEKKQVEHAEMLRRVRLQAVNGDGDMVGVHIDTGEWSGSGLKYLNGGAPKGENEIALSFLMAEELEKGEGDILLLFADSETREFKVCGIYQDVTSGGRTAKTVCDFSTEAAEKYTYHITLSTDVDAAAFTVSMREKLGSGYSIENMEEFLRQTLGGVTGQIRQAAIAVLFIGLFLTVLIMALFLKLRLAREIYALAAKKAMGIPFDAICLQELFPVLIAGGAGSACGLFAAELLGDDLISGLFGLLGIGLKKILFVKAPFWQPVTTLAVLLVILSTVTVGICMQIKKINIADYISQ